MSVTVDSYMTIGKRHLVCEDYIISGYDPVPYVILSDGCSSSEESDIGARILTHFAKQFIKYNRDGLREESRTLYPKIGNFVIHNAESLIRSLGLKLSCLDATLIVAFVIKDYVRVFIYGDGNIILIDPRSFTFRLKRYSISFSDGAPYYLTYWINSKWKSDYFRRFGGKRTTTVQYLSPEDITNDSFVESALGRVYFRFSFDMWPIILIASDGIDSFRTIKDGSIIPTFLVYKCLTKFKGMAGEFVKRRTKRAIRDIEREYNCIHTDDISVGGIYNQI